MKKILIILIVLFGINILAGSFEDDKAVSTSWYNSENEVKGYENRIKEILNKEGYISVLTNKKINFKDYLCEISLILVDDMYIRKQQKSVATEDYYTWCTPASFKRDFMCKAINDNEILFDIPSCISGIIDIDSGVTYIFDPEAPSILDLETLKREGFELNNIAETIRKYLKENPEYSKAILESEERYLKKCKEIDKDYEIINKRIKRRGITNDLDAKIVETQYFMQKDQRKQKKK